MRLVLALTEAGVTFESLIFGLRPPYHSRMTIPIPLRRIKNGVSEELCIHCLSFTKTQTPTCEICAEERVPYDDESFLGKRIELLETEGYLDSDENENQIGIAIAAEATPKGPKVAAMFSDHSSHFANYLEDARFIDSFSLAKKWHEAATLEMLKYFPLPKSRFEGVANYKAATAATVADRLKSIWLLYPNDRVKWMSRVAALKLGLSPETDFFASTIKDHVQLTSTRSEIGAYKFDDDLINEFYFTLFHPSVLAHPAFERLLASIDKKRMALLLNGYDCKDEALKPWVRLALHFCEALPADPDAVGDIALSQKILAGAPISGTESLAVIGVLEPNRQIEILESLSNDELLIALTRIKPKGLWPLLRLLHSKLAKLDRESKPARELESALESAVNAAPVEKVAELFETALELRDPRILTALLWRMDAVSDAQWSTLIPVFRENSEICDAFRKAPHARSFKLGLDLDPLLEDPRLRGWALEFVKRGDAIHENANRSFFRFFLAHARDLDRETMDLATWSIPKLALPPAIFDAETVKRLLELLSESPLDDDSRFDDWFQKNDEALRTSAAGWPSADSLMIFDEIVNRFAKLNRHRRFFSKFLAHLSINGDEVALRAGRLRDLKVGEKIDNTYWLDRILEKAPKDPSHVDGKVADAKRAADDAQKAVEEAKRAASAAQTEVAEARRQLEQMKLQNELLNLQMWLQKEIAACQMNGALSHEQRATRFTEIQKEYELKVAKLIEAQTKS